VAEVGRLSITSNRRRYVSRVRKEWTLKQALAAQERFVARGGRRFGDPRSPQSQWWALNDLDCEEARFRGGDKYALAMALRICANHALALPSWVARAYIDGFDAVHMNRDRSWDLLFGPAILKKALRNREDKSGAVMLEIQRLHRAKVGHPHKSDEYFTSGEPIDDELFAKVGKNLGIGTTLVKKYYRHEKNRYKQPPYQARSKK
jgi:hypothetical protein